MKHNLFIPLFILLLLLLIPARGNAQSLHSMTHGYRSPYGRYRERLKEAASRIALRCPLEQRERIYREMVMGEARARMIAEVQFPLPTRITVSNDNFVQIQQMRRFQAMMRGIERCHRDIRRRYSLTEDEREAISEEGTERHRGEIQQGR